MQVIFLIFYIILILIIKYFYVPVEPLIPILFPKQIRKVWSLCSSR